MAFRTMDFKERHFPNIAASHRKRLGVFIATVVLLFFWKDIIRDSLDYGYTKAIYHRHQESLGPIANETLGVSLFSGSEYKTPQVN